MPNSKYRRLFVVLLLIELLAVVTVTYVVLAEFGGADARPDSPGPETMTETPEPPVNTTEPRPGYNPVCDPDPTDDEIPENVSLPNCGDDMAFTNESGPGM